MSRTIRALLVVAIVIVCWAIYAVLGIAVERQQLPNGGFGELYGPLVWLRGFWFWLSVVATGLGAAAMTR